MAFIGSKGGRAKGESKRRSREQYAKVAEAQRERWKRYRAAKEQTAKANGKNGSANKR